MAAKVPYRRVHSGGSRGGRALPPLFWVKKEEMTEGRKAGWASKLKPGPLLSSKSRSATGTVRKPDSVVHSAGKIFLHLSFLHFCFARFCVLSHPGSLT